MKNLVAIFTLMTIASGLQAQEQNQAEQNPGNSSVTNVITPRYEILSKKLYRYKFELGLLGRTWDYKEYSTGRGLFMRDHGNLYGFKMSAQTLWSGSYFGRASLEYASGKTQYDGGLQNVKTGESTPYSHQTSNSQIVVEGLMGSIFVPSDSREFSIAPYSGLSIKDHSNPRDDSSPGSYSREITQLFIPVGLEFKAGLSQKTMMGLDLRYSRLLVGVVDSKLSEVSPAFSDHTNIQNSGQTYQVVGEIAYNGQDVGVALRPFFRYSNIAVSEISERTADRLSVIEPKNTTAETGLEATIRF